ncbi:hypothetical protein HLB35_04220 [Halomonas sp. TBZ9]|uniref:Uncharacterized protein n=1 Tax=Vreelandella azerica TaxID=2732867 RepID=A0A7Y3XAG4_9GAMM|nr:hypothetical protein [Halomonas azerica]NOG31170.1 hypothetical protein [Halomonas azerica]
MLFRLPPTRAEHYSPLYFLAALGAGGLTVSFFMWLMFWLPHPSIPVPTFDALYKVLIQGSLFQRFILLAGGVGVALFAYLHFRLLVWNLLSYREFRVSPSYQSLRSSNDEVQLLAAPLALAMSVNVCFIVSLVFIPGVWSVVEWLFPLATLAMLAIGGWAMALLKDYWGRVLTEGGFDVERNNSFAQLLPAFALAMVAVGLSAPAAMSQHTGTAVLSLILSSFFMMMAIIIGAVKLILGLRDMLIQGANPEAAPTLWVVVPIITVLTIALVRQTHGIDHHLGEGAGGIATFSMLTNLLAVQVAFTLLGWVVLRRHRYFARFVTGPERSPGSYTLVCPGVALAVMLHFFINLALAKNGAIVPKGAVYWGLSLVAVTIQAATIWLVWTLNRKHFDPDNLPAFQATAN